MAEIATVKVEDSINAILIAEGATDKAEESTKNNDFCFTKEDFIDVQMKMNDDKVHQGNHNAECTIIKELNVQN